MLIPRDNRYRQSLAEIATPYVARAAGRQVRRMFDSYMDSNDMPYKRSARGGRKVKYAKTKRRGEGLGPSKIKQMDRKITRLKKSEDASLGTMTYRSETKFTVSSAVNVQALTVKSHSSASGLEGILANLKFYDPSNPATLVTADFTSGTYQKEVLFEKFTSTIKLRNNYKNDCRVRVYLGTPRVDTSINMDVAWSNGATDQGGVANTVINTYPTDYQQVLKLWNLKMKVNKVLKPSQSVTASHSNKEFRLDPSFLDSHASAYQKSMGNAQWLIVVSGTLGHDSAVADQVGYTASKLDATIRASTKIQYDAGVNIKYNVISNTFDTFTNGAVQSQKPEVANQAQGI